MAGTLTTGEEAQVAQTIEMFEVITQSQPQDYQSLEILKEAYAKLNREKDVVRTAKRIAQVYVSLGQLSSAILEYESILQRYPDDPDVLAALGEIESKAGSLGSPPPAPEAAPEPEPEPPPPPPKPTKAQQPSKPKAAAAGAKPAPPTDLDDGKQGLHKIFVEGKVITQAHFDECWVKPDRASTPTKPIEPFIQILADKGFAPLDKALKLLSDKARLGFLPLEKYDIDLEFARTFPAESCLRWCVLPFDRLSKSVLVATCNPFNRQAAAEIEEVTKQRLVWYLTPPQELMKALRKVYRSAAAA